MKELRFDPREMCTHVHVPFSLAKEYESLGIDFEYSPKEIEDEKLAAEIIRNALAKYAPDRDRGDISGFFPVTNLLTLSLDYEDDYIGCAHRGAPEQHIIITAESASPGFIPHPVKPGGWNAAIALHAVSVPVKCKLHVWGR